MKRLASVLVLLLGARGAIAQESGAQANTWPGVGAGEETAKEDDTVKNAREAFKNGAASARDKRWSDALEAFRRSAALRPHPVTTYDMGYCEKELGHVTRARRALRDALAQQDTTGAALPEKYRVEAVRYLEALEQTVARLTVVLDRDLDHVLVDRAPLEEDRENPSSPVYVAGLGSPSDTGPPVSGNVVIVLDPGKHVLLGTHAGTPEASLTVDLRPGEALTIRLLRTTEPAPDASLRAPRVEHGPSWQRIAGFSALGVGAAGLIVGSVFGGLALATKSDLDGTKDCTKVGDKVECQPSRTNDVDALHFQSNAATVGFVVGGIGVATGAALLIFGPATAETARTAGVQPWVGPASAGIRGAF